jgi:2,5-diketo-D-gluconate reductase B
MSRHIPRLGLGTWGRTGSGGGEAIPASSRREHLEANWRAADLRLSTNEMTVIDALDRGQRLVDPEKSPAWD